MTLQFFKIHLNRPIDETYLKSQWRGIALKHHPDKGGDLETFKKAQAEYEYILSHKGMGYTAVSDSPESFGDWEDFIFSVSPIIRQKAYECKEVCDKYGSELEVCGSWIWIDNTMPSMAKELKAIGLKWAGRKKKWFYAGTEKLSKGRIPMETIRSLYGSETYKKKEDEKKMIA